MAAAQKVLAVVLDDVESNEIVMDRLSNRFANIYEHTKTFILVPVELSISAYDVAATAGIKGNDRDVTGVVFKLNAAYSGYTKKTLWEWLGNVEGS